MAVSNKKCWPASPAAANPARDQHPEDVAVREQRDVAGDVANAGDDAIDARSDLCRATRRPGQPSRKIIQPGRFTSICSGVSPSYSP